jgi:RNA polymerase binding protein RbpA
MPHISGGFRGTRVGAIAGAPPPPESDNPEMELMPRLRISYWCTQGHETPVVFSLLPVDQIPEQWDCVRCGRAAGRTANDLPLPTAFGDQPFKSHLDYVKERRSVAEGEQLLEEALERLRHRRGRPGRR